MSVFIVSSWGFWLTRANPHLPLAEITANQMLAAARMLRLQLHVLL